MQHSINLQTLTQEMGTQAEQMTRAIEACVHCGFCLPTCPTYLVLGEEMDSPRGRIVLMKSVLEGQLQLGDSLPFVDRCLGCLACVTACPSGVRYAELVTPFKAYAQKRRRLEPGRAVARAVVRNSLPYPRRMRVAVRLGAALRPVHKALPQRLAMMLSLMPDQFPNLQVMPAFTPAQGERRARVGLLTGCVQQVIDPSITRAAIRLLSCNGVDVHVPVNQGCCGALSLHMGEPDKARQLAHTNLDLFPADLDAILTTAAGCGSGIHEYPALFSGRALASQAAAFSSRVVDISQFLSDLELRPVTRLKRHLRVAYHDACHLQHAQGITEAPRQLLQSVPGLVVIDVPENGICCGSAGVYNLEQPEIADQLGRRKVALILSAQTDVIVTGNIGCMVQLRNHLVSLGKSVPVMHTIQLLDLAFQSLI